MSSSRIAIYQSSVNKIKKLAAQYTQHYASHFSAEDQQIWQLMSAVLQEAKGIHSCDLPTDSSDDVPLVYIVQKYADYVLGNSNETPVKNFDRDKASPLEKILKVAALSQQYSGGNCQEKAFYGLYSLLHKLLTCGLMDAQKAIPLELAYYNNHFIVLVNNKFLLDPWLDFACPIDPSNVVLSQLFQGFGNLKRYFLIDANWYCYFSGTATSSMQYDAKSTAYTYTLAAAWQPQQPPQQTATATQQTVVSKDEATKQLSSSANTSASFFAQEAVARVQTQQQAAVVTAKPQTDTKMTMDESTSASTSKPATAEEVQGFKF
jgi:hypothetical protein